MSATLPPLQLPLVRPSRVAFNEETGEYEIKAETKLDAPPPASDDGPAAAPWPPAIVIVTIAGGPDDDAASNGSYHCPLVGIQTLSSEYGAYTIWEYSDSDGTADNDHIWSALYLIGPGLGPAWNPAYPWSINVAVYPSQGTTFQALNVPFATVVKNQQSGVGGGTGMVSG